METSFFKIEKKVPPATWGNFLVGWSYAFAAATPPLPLPGPDKSELKLSGSDVSVAAEQQISQNLAVKGSLSISKLLDEKLPQVWVAIAERSPRKFMAILAEAAKVEIKLPGMTEKLPWEVGFEIVSITTTPVSIKAKPSWALPVDPKRPEGGIVLKGEMAALIGLSPAGWELALTRVSPQVLRSFFAEAGTNLLGSLNSVVASAGGYGAVGIAAGGVLAMLAYTGAGLYAIGKAAKTGDLENLAGVAAGAYVGVVWGKGRPSGWVSDPKLGDALLRHGEGLALEHARKVVAEVPGARGSSDDNVLHFYRQFLETYHGGQSRAYETTYLKVRKETYDALRHG